MIVDDQIFNIEAMKVILKLCNIDLEKQVEIAFNGQQAVDKVKERTEQNMFDIIFMDLNMPFMDGATATKEIRDYIFYQITIPNGKFKQLLKPNNEDILQPTIVAVTGHTEDSFLAPALGNGIDLILPKPATSK